MKYNSVQGAHPVRVLELFAGSRSFGKVCDERGIPVFSCDLEPFDRIDHVGDFLQMRHEDLPWAPSLIVAGVPCTSYSICGIRYHRRDLQPTSKTAEIGDQLVKKTIEWARHYGCAVVIENPRGMLRKMPFSRAFDRRTVWYCRYGDHRAKPTDIWSNLYRSLWNPEGWDPRPECYNGNRHCHHDRQPRTYSKRKELGVEKLGTTGLANPYLRSMYPPQLVEEILDHAVHQISNQPNPTR